MNIPKGKFESGFCVLNRVLYCYPNGKPCNVYAKAGEEDKAFSFLLANNVEQDAARILQDADFEVWSKKAVLAHCRFSPQMDDFDWNGATPKPLRWAKK